MPHGREPAQQSLRGDIGRYANEHVSAPRNDAADARAEDNAQQVVRDEGIGQQERSPVDHLTRVGLILLNEDNYFNVREERRVPSFLQRADEDDIRFAGCDQTRESRGEALRGTGNQQSQRFDCRRNKLCR